MRICILWDWDRAKEIFPNWRDGQRAALEYVGKKHQLDWYFGDECKDVGGDYDFYLFWSDPSNNLIDNYLKYPGRRGLMLTTDLGLPGNISKYNVVYCESDPVLQQVKPFAQRAIKAHGTDSDFFSPDPSVEKDIEYFYPATFSPWKRQSQIARLGKRLLCVGTVQPDGKDELEACQKAGVRLEIGYFPAEKIRDYYRRAKGVIIPAVHGSERTVLEALSMNLVPEVLNDENRKATSYMKEYAEFYARTHEKSPRAFVLENYSEETYAEALLRGIEDR